MVISLGDYKCVSDTNMQSHRKEREDMEKKTKYYVVREKDSAGGTS